MASDFNEFSNSESIWYPDLHELHIDFSLLLNESCIVILTGWKPGISWSVVVAGETERHSNPFEESLFPIEFFDDNPHTIANIFKAI